MKTLFALITLLAVALIVPPAALAKKSQGAPASTTSKELRIVEVDPASVTVAIGTGGDDNMTYRITSDTKVTLNGAPVFARDLKAGMVAKVSVSPDHSTALSIAAKDAPANPARRRVG